MPDPRNLDKDSLVMTVPVSSCCSLFLFGGVVSRISRIALILSLINSKAFSMGDMMTYGESSLSKMQLLSGKCCSHLFFADHHLSLLDVREGRRDSEDNLFLLLSCEIVSLAFAL